MWQVTIDGQVITGDMVSRVIAYDREGNEREDYYSPEVYFYTLELSTGEEIDVLRDDLDHTTEELLLDAIVTI
ncbi:hypothetical protein NIES4103_28050 [Nostoc sp. NIES-4103]|nr:hypothetical protein NIES4103_28050 [Nostoc sp. NIES-4103]